MWCNRSILALLNIFVTATKRCGSARAVLGSLAATTHHCPGSLQLGFSSTRVLQRAVHALFNFEPRELNEIYHKHKDFA